MSGEKVKSSIKEWPIDERPREKAMLHGISSLSKSELLAILVGSGNDEESAVGLMKRVLASCGDSIAELARLSVDDLCQFRGIGPAKAKRLLQALGSYPAVKKATVEELSRVKGISSADAEKIYRYFNSK